MLAYKPVTFLSKYNLFFTLFRWIFFSFEHICSLFDGPSNSGANVAANNAEILQLADTSPVWSAQVRDQVE